MLHARKLATFQIFCNFKSYFLGHYRAVPNRFLHVPVTQAFHDGCIQSFVLVIFPVIATFFSDDILRQVSRAFWGGKMKFLKTNWKKPKICTPFQALWHRTGGFLTGTPPMSPSFPRRSLRTYSQTHEVLPMFMQRDSLAEQHRKISLPPPNMRRSMDFK